MTYGSSHWIQFLIYRKHRGQRNILNDTLGIWLQKPGCEKFYWTNDLTSSTNKLYKRKKKEMQAEIYRLKKHMRQLIQCVDLIWKRTPGPMNQNPGTAAPMQLHCMCKAESSMAVALDGYAAGFSPRFLLRALMGPLLPPIPPSPQGWVGSGEGAQGLVNFRATSSLDTAVASPPLHLTEPGGRSHH